MISFCRLPLCFDSVRLKADVDRIPPGEWIPHFNGRNYEGEWSGVALRSVGGSAGQLYSDPSAKAAYADTPTLTRCPELQGALWAFQCPLTSVRLLKLKAGSTVREHRDHQLCYEDGEVRVHIPVVTNSGVDFFLEDKRLVMLEGECWYVNFNLPHRVENRGTTDRIHLVIDCVLNDWLRSMFPREASAPDARESSILPSGEGVQALGTQAFDQFREAVLHDVSLQQRLRESLDRQGFIDLTVQLGNGQGYKFTAGDVESALQASRRSWLNRWTVLQ